MVKKFTNISINMALDLETDLKFACWGRGGALGLPLVCCCDMVQGRHVKSEKSRVIPADSRHDGGGS